MQAGGLLLDRQQQEGQSGRLRQSGRTPESSPLPRFCEPRRSNCCVLHFLQYCGWAGRAVAAVSATRRQQRACLGGRRAAAAAPTAQAQPDPRTLVASVRTSRHSLLMQRLCARGSLSPSGLSFAPSAIWAAALAQRRLLTACDHSRGLSAGPSRCCRAPRRRLKFACRPNRPTARRSPTQASRASSR